MSIEQILNAYGNTEQVKQLLQLLNEPNKDNRDVHVSGLMGSMDAFIGAAVFKNSSFNHVFILSDKE
jgi:hypothetical protein